MPPKPAAKGAAAKGPTKAPAKTGTSKGATGTTKTGTKTGTASKDAAKQTDTKKVEQDMAKMTIKKVLVPEEIELKQVAGLVALGGDVGEKLKKSERWLFMIDRNGNVHTFLKYRDVNMISVTSALEFDKEPLRKALMGALRFGKPHIIDVSNTDQSKVMAIVEEAYNKIYPGLWNDLMDRTILDFEKCSKLYQANDDSEYKNEYDYRVSDFQFMVYTNTDPPSSANDSFFPVIIN